MKPLPLKWISYLRKIDFAFQPILNINTGILYGVEALFRNHKEIGFGTIFDIFDKAYEENILYSFDIALREKAFEKFKQIKDYQNIKLFYNLDNRILNLPDYTQGNTEKILEKINLSKENICFEISEHQKISNKCNLTHIINHYYKEEGFSVAIDDFGMGISGYKLLYDSTPNIIKIDRFFIQDIDKHHKKKIMFKSISDLAMQLGVKVVAEGVETKEEFLACKDLGCDFIQGYLVQKPTTDTEKITKTYKNIVEIIKLNKRNKRDKVKLKTYIDKIEPLNIKKSMKDVFKYFRAHKNNNFIPIVNKHGEPMGIIEEKDVKEYIYSNYGREILINKKGKIKYFLKECPAADIKTPISKIIELYSNNPESPGIIITNNNSYFGFLSSNAIVKLVHEKNLLYAREQNPLTKLPGNIMIDEHMEDVINNCDFNFLLCYFDLDNFKAFNDKYSFRNGDRVIQLFADILKNELPKEFFKAHIGGDDFFCAVQNEDKEDLYDKLAYIKHVIEKFKSDVREFYSKEDRENGYIIAKDRDGKLKKFPLLSVSASILVVSKNSKNRSLNTIQSILANQKKIAKSSINDTAISELL